MCGGGGGGGPPLVLGCTSELVSDELPVHDLPDLLHVVRAAVLEVHVVRVLPNIDGEEGSLSINDRAASVTGVLDGELAGLRVSDEPGPSAAEVTDGLGLEVLLKVFHGAKGGDDGLLKGLGHGLTVVDQALPEEGVVEVLSGLVEEDFLLRLAGGLLDNLLDGEAIILILSKIIELVNVCLVVLVVVQVELLAGNDGLEAILDGVEKGGEGGQRALGLHKVGERHKGHRLDGGDQRG